MDPIPGHASAKVAELRCGKPARDQPQNALEHLCRQIVERIRGSNQVKERRHVPGLHRDARDDLLRQHVEATMRHTQMLDCAREHRAAQCGRFQQITRGLGDQPPFADAPHHVPCPTDSLKPSHAHAARRFDLADEVNRPHIDPQLQGRGRHDRRERTLLQGLFRYSPLGEADAAVMRSERPRVASLDCDRSSKSVSSLSRLAVFGSRNCTSRGQRPDRASALSRAVSFSTVRRLLAKTIVER